MHPYSGLEEISRVEAVGKNIDTGSRAQTFKSWRIIELDSKG